MQDAPGDAGVNDNVNDKRKSRLKAVDLFAGSGGLSLGLRWAGFDIATAVEKDATAAKTYRYNHRRTVLLERDITEINAPELLRHVRGTVSVLAGCAPCQGFCSLTNKNKRRDPRNQLVLEMARLVRGLQPQVVFMENVPGILTRGRRVFRAFVNALLKLDYVCSYRVVQMADFGVPQYRRRLVLLAGRGFLVPFPSPTHVRAPNPESSLKPWVNVRRAIGHLGAPLTLADVVRNGGPHRYNWHVARELQPQTKLRLRAATPGKTWLTVDEQLRPECHQQNYKGFMNTYGRMTWDDVSPTITAGCTTPCKGRFGHPDRRRYAISVREAAILQSFPEIYGFRTNQIDNTCDLIGNAVPPLFARAVGTAIRKALAARNGSVARKR